MATLYKKDGSPYYWMRFSHKGTRYQESTKKKREDHALTIMEKRIDEIKGSGSYNDLFDRLLNTLDKLPEKPQAKIRQELAAKLLSGTACKLPISEAFDLYKKKPKKRNPGTPTLKHYEGYWKRFSKWLTEKHPDIQYMHEIDHPLAVQYMTHVWKRGVTERTYNGNLVFLRGTFNLLKTEAGLASNPWDGIDKQELKTVSKKMLTTEQLESVCATATGEIKTLILIGIYTGLRLGDVSTLKWSEVSLDTGNIERMPSKTKKQGKTITIPIHAILRKVLHDIQRRSLGNSEYVLPELANQYKKHSHYVSQQVQKVFKDAGIETTSKRDDGRGRRLSCLYGFHSFRHSFVSLCHASNVPQIAVMELVGHNSEQVHKIYQHASDELKQQAIAALPDVTNGEQW